MLLILLLASEAHADIAVDGGGGGEATRFVRALARGSVKELRSLTAWPFAGPANRCDEPKSLDAMLGCLVRDGARDRAAARAR